MMTPWERAQKLAHDYALAGCWNAEALSDAVHLAIIAATNDEVNKRRGLEAQLAGIQAGGPVIVAEKMRCTLRVWNPETSSWWETNLIQMPGVKP